MPAVRIAYVATAITLALAGCGPGSGSAGMSVTPTASATPVDLGTVTISDSACAFDAPSRLPVGRIRLKLVNMTTHAFARFILIKLTGGHTFKDLEDLTKNGFPERPDWVTEPALIDVPRGETRIMDAAVTRGQYAFHCGYPDDSGGATAFWKGPLEGS